MKRMNLLPPELRPRDGKRAGSAYVVVAMLGVSVVAMLAYGLVLSGVHSDESDLASVKEEISRAADRAQALAPYGEFADMKDRRERSVVLVADTRFDYERLTRELARILPDGVSVGHLEVAPAPPADDVVSAGADSAAATSSAEVPAMTVSGCAPGQGAVADTLDRLNALTGATGVKLGASGDGGADGGSSAANCGGGVSFDATVTLTAPGAETTPTTTQASVETDQ